MQHAIHFEEPIIHRPIKLWVRVLVQLFVYIGKTAMHCLMVNHKTRRPVTLSKSLNLLVHRLSDER